MFYFSTFFFGSERFITFSIDHQTKCAVKKNLIFLEFMHKIVELTNEYFDKEIRSLVFENENSCYVIEDVPFS